MRFYRFFLFSLVLSIGCASPAEKNGSSFEDDVASGDLDDEDRDPEDDPEDDPETDTGDPEDIQPPDEPLDTGIDGGHDDPRSDEPVANGSQVYNANCQGCHGYPHLFAERVAEMTEAEVYEQIRYGGGYMPAQDHLSDQEIEAVMEYLGG